jgi:hypothetical protein
MPDSRTASVHVLLVGIDDYPAEARLRGCVSDIDAIERFLLERLQFPPSAITKLAAPLPEASRTSQIAEQLPALATLRAALAALGSERVNPGDRVFIYYSGHGARDGRGAAHLEALVPVDFQHSGLLYDVEFNSLIQAIARRTTDLTIVLDCCHSAGATREALSATDGTSRRLPPEALANSPQAEVVLGGPPSSLRGLVEGLAPNGPDYLVAASCQADQLALERELPPGSGQRHGVFTWALLRALEGRTPESLREVCWSDIWPVLRSSIAHHGSSQMPCLIGQPERHVFGGPFRPRDAGYTLARTPTGYQVGAGTLSGLSRGALVAVYGREPDRFPPLDSPEDLRARAGLLQVTSAELASADAVPVSLEAGARPSTAGAVGSAKAFELPEGARGRLVWPGEIDRLVVALTPYDANLASFLESEAGVRVVQSWGPGTEAQVGVERDGAFWIGDDIHGDDPSGSREPPLAWIPDGSREALVRGLIHHARYNSALRLARRSHDLPGALDVRLLDCNDAEALKQVDPNAPLLPEARADPDQRYAYGLRPEDGICVTVRNRARQPLYVTLINCATSGRVELLGSGVQLAPDKRTTFWLGGNIRQPFTCGLPAGRSSGVDRLIAIGTTRPGVDLAFLKLETSFEETLNLAHRELTPLVQQPREAWTARIVTLRIGSVD